MKKILSLFVFSLSLFVSNAQTYEYKQVWSADNGDGTYVNPVINGDFPDIDVVRVGDTFYMVSTTMYLFPGATIMKSKDLVNWEYCANPLEQVLDNDAYNLMNGKHHYSQGMWASSLTYHDGKFYLYFPCSTWSEDSQSILLTAEDPEGEWKLTRLSEAYHDPGWLFDDGEKGDGYLYVACGIGDIYVNKFNASTLKKISSSKVISVGNGCEGSHMYHIGDYYYIYATYGGTEGSQTIFRSKKPMGPYEEHNGRVFANQKIHQGALIETQTGEWWTMLFKDAGSIGRIPYLEPVKWVDGWPVIGNNGIDVSKNGASYKKPNVGKTYEKIYLPTNDAFTDTKLGMQWQWNHNPDNSAWSLTERPGHLRLYTANVTSELNTARNSLSQRILGYSPNGTSTNSYKSSYGSVKLDLSGMQDGDVAGLAVWQNPYSFLGVKMENGKKFLYSERCSFDGQKLKKEEKKNGTSIKGDVLYLRAVVNFATNACKYYYSTDGKKWTTSGVTMNMRYTLDYFVGQRFYLFNYATKRLGGYVDFDGFTTEQNWEDEEALFGGEDTPTKVKMTGLTMADEAVELMAGSVKALGVTMTDETGKQWDVASFCTYEISNQNVAKVSGGRLVTMGNGETDIVATFTDVEGKTATAKMHVKVVTFPMTKEDLNPSLIGKGTVTVSSRFSSLTTAKNGLGGWRYAAGVDWSAYKYLVVKLVRMASCSPSFCIYDADDTSAAPYVCEMGKEKTVVIDLHNMKNSAGGKIDPSRVFLAGFSSTGESAIYLSELFLSNDGETDATGVAPLFASPTREGRKTEFFGVDGRRTDGARPGINIQRTTLPDGSTESRKVLRLHQ